MKIAVISSQTPSLLRFRADMMKAFLKRGHEVVAIGDEEETSWKDKFREIGVEYRQVAIQRNGLNPLKDIQTLFSIRKVLIEEQVEKVFTYYAKAVVYGGLAARSLGILDVYALLAGVGSVFISNDIKTRIIRTVLSWEYRLSLRFARHVFFQNQDDVNVFLKRRIVDEKKVVMINGSGVNLEMFPPLPLLPKTAFLCVARLIRDKGICEYLEACRLLKQRCPGVRCILVGPYDTNPTALKPNDIQSYVDKGVIEYFGEQSDVRPFLAQCNVFVLPSYREGTPKAVLEAMASGKAIVTTDAPGCKETVINGTNGYLVPVGDINALVSCMQELLIDRDKLQRMALESRRIAEERFDVNLVNLTIVKTMGV